MKNRLFLLFFLLAGVASVSAKTYIVAVSGTSTGAGTTASPYDIATAVSKAVANDTIYIRGGQYMMTAQLSLSKGGSASGRINIWAYPGDARPVLDFYNRGYSGTNSAAERGVSISKSYYDLRGLDITRAGDNGMHISGSYNRIENCRFYKNCDAGLQITGATTSEGYNLIINCDAYLNFDFKSSGGAGGNADGFACKLTVGPGNKFIGCRSWNNSDDAYDCYGSINDVYFKGCWAIANGVASYDVTDYPGSMGITTVVNTGNGNGFKVGGNYAVGGAILIDCISTGHKIASSSNKGFDQNNNVGRVFCFNCLSYNDGRGFSFPNNTDARGPHLFYNNIVLSANNSNSINASSIQLTNTWNNITVATSDFISLATDSAKSARNADGSLTNMGGLFRLKSSSNLINKGTVILVDTIGMPYVGSSPDLGPFEYNPATAIPVNKIKSENLVSCEVIGKNLLFVGLANAIHVYDLNGKQTYVMASEARNAVISADGWQKGIYVASVTQKDGTITSEKIRID
ncbi:MAG TPA: T9SS type A sorting domain-containing protein [Bacteroidales bacterium]|nr:T9SS type A sorting domain-containing protein [Bacteroidales bacterium]